VHAEGIKNGLDFEQAVNDPEMVEMVTSTQVLHACLAAKCLETARWSIMVPCEDTAQHCKQMRSPKHGCMHNCSGTVAGQCSSFQHSGQCSNSTWDG
jgi:hypothetical protein